MSAPAPAPWPPAAGPSGDNARLSRPARRRRPRRVVENDDFLIFARRIIRAAGRRIAGGDVESLATLVSLSKELDESINAAAVALHEAGYSWGEIAARLGVSRQAARQRWGAGS